MEVVLEIDGARAYHGIRDVDVDVDVDVGGTGSDCLLGRRDVDSVAVEAAWLRMQLALDEIKHVDEVVSVDTAPCSGQVHEDIALLCSSGLKPLLRSWIVDELQPFFTGALYQKFWKFFSDFKPFTDTKQSCVWAESALQRGLTAVRPQRHGLDVLVGVMVDCFGERDGRSLRAQYDTMWRALFFPHTPLFREVLRLFFLKHFCSFCDRHARRAKATRKRRRRRRRRIRRRSDDDDDSGEDVEEEEEEEEEDTIMEDEEDDDDDDDDSSDSEEEDERESVGWYPFGSGDDDDETQSPDVAERESEALLCILREFHLCRASDDIWGDVLLSIIHLHIEKKCKGVFDMMCLHRMQVWVRCTALAWIRTIVGPSSCDVVSRWATKLECTTDAVFAKMRIAELFDMIVEFPDSVPSLLDLKECLSRTAGARSLLVTSLRASYHKRLLHPGASTTDIITQYLASIKALHHIDPSGVMLESVSGPIRQYLNLRGDTIRCIITSLTEDSSSELHQELTAADKPLLEQSDSEDETEEDRENWMPAPIEALPFCGITGSRRGTSDLLSTLVNIYGSKELFVNEYRAMLAERLLTICDYNTNKEIETLELLKLRFGEQSLLNCEVMLKDMADSKRVNNNVQSRAKAVADAKSEGESEAEGDVDLPIGVLSATTVSHLFWPRPPKDDPFEFPDRLQKTFDQYTALFQKHKAARTLEWMPGIGTVTLSVTYEDGQSVEFVTTPFHAAVLSLYREKKEWTVADIAKALQSKEAAVKRKLKFWTNNQVLKEVTTGDSDGDGDAVYVAVSNKREEIRRDVVDDEDAGQQQSAQQQHQENLFNVCDQFIVGMLGNLGSLPLDRVHTMLSNFVDTYDLSPAQLRTYMDRLVAEDRVECVSGEYSLKR